jgi:lipoprotein-anchoring transpeptidase ErfK/SrfK
MGSKITQRIIEIDLARQRLVLKEGDSILLDTTVSTARNGAGEINGSECTPRGRHVIHEKIGSGCEVNSVFVGRQPTGELYSRRLAEKYPGRDWILTRILWLDGTEEGINKSGNVDTLQRFVYIHGSPDNVTMGEPGSHGCIRLRNDDVIRLFDLVDVGTPVMIRES